MKCMSVPANLTWDEWRNLAIRQLRQLNLEDAYDDVMFPQLFKEGFTVNEAVSLAIEAYYGDD